MKKSTIKVLQSRLLLNMLSSACRLKSDCESRLHFWALWRCSGTKVMALHKLEQWTEQDRSKARVRLPDRRRKKGKSDILAGWWKSGVVFFCSCFAACTNFDDDFILVTTYQYPLPSILSSPFCIHVLFSSPSACISPVFTGRPVSHFHAIT